MEVAAGIPSSSILKHNGRTNRGFDRKKEKTENEKKKEKKAIIKSRAAVAAKAAEG